MSSRYLPHASFPLTESSTTRWLARKHEFLSRGRILLIVSCATYYLLLLFSYTHIESVIYAYRGLTNKPPGALFQILGFGIGLLPALWMPISLRYPSEVCYWILYLTVVLPLSFLSFNVLQEPASQVWVLPAVITVLFGILYFSYRFRKIALPRIRIDQRVTYVLLVVAGLGLSVVMYVLQGFELKTSWEDVYVRRLLARSTVPGGSLFAYAIAFFANTINPILIGLGYVRKNIVMLTTGILGAVVVFSMLGTKFDMFIPLVFLVFFVLAKKFHYRLGVALPLAMSFVVLCSLLENILFGSFDISAFVVTRQMIIPGFLTSLYWEYFSQNPLIYYSDSFLRWLIPSNENIGTARLIGLEYFNSIDTNANANIWASAYANLGYLGLVVVTVLLGVVFRVIDGLATRENYFIVVLMCMSFGLVWSNGALETSMFSDSIFPSLLILYLLGGGNERKGERLSWIPLRKKRIDKLRVYGNI